MPIPYEGLARLCSFENEIRDKISELVVLERNRGKPGYDVLIDQAQKEYASLTRRRIELREELGDDVLFARKGERVMCTNGHHLMTFARNIYAMEVIEPDMITIDSPRQFSTGEVLGNCHCGAPYNVGGAMHMEVGGWRASVKEPYPMPIVNERCEYIYWPPNWSEAKRQEYRERWKGRERERDR